MKKALLFLALILITATSVYAEDKLTPRNTIIDTRNAAGYGFYSYYNPKDYEFDTKNLYYYTYNHGSVIDTRMGMQALSKPCTYGNGAYVRENCREPLKDVDFDILTFKMPEYGILDVYATNNYLFEDDDEYLYTYALDENDLVAKYQKVEKDGNFYWQKVSVFKPTQSFSQKTVQTGLPNYGGYWGNHKIVYTPAEITQYDTRGNIISVFKRYYYINENGINCGEHTDYIEEVDKNGNLIARHYERKRTTHSDSSYVPFLQWDDTPKHKQEIFQRFSTVYPELTVVDLDGNVIYQGVNKTFKENMKDTGSLFKNIWHCFF